MPESNCEKFGSGLEHRLLEEPNDGTQSPNMQTMAMPPLHEPGTPDSLGAHPPDGGHLCSDFVMCVGCGGRITERWFSKTQEGPWHAACLRCIECHSPLQEKCFAKHGHLYCREDYYRIFGCGRCTRCNLDIGPQELVMRAREFVYHLNCFICAICHVQLHKGDHFGMREGVIYCRPHYEMILQTSDPELESVPGMTLGMGGSPMGNILPNFPLTSLGSRLFYNGVGSVQKGRPRKRKCPSDEMQPMTPLPPGLDLLGPPGDLSLESFRYDHQNAGVSHNRTKRMRTSFKHHQIRTMKSYFALNQNPDAKDLKQLAQKTGLSKRVLQVWFQNARAKWRRNILKQEHDRHLGDKIKDPSSLLGELRSVENMSGQLADLSGYSMSSGDEGSTTMSYSDMCSQ